MVKKPSGQPAPPRRVADHTYRKEEFSDQDFSGCQFHTVIFQGCRFRCCDFSHARFVNCQFQDCTLDRCYFLQSELLYTQFYKCTGSSVNLSLSSLKFTVWSSCTLAYPVFSKTSWENSSVQDCRFQEPYIPASTLNKTTFLRSDWSKGNFIGTSLSGMNLSSCRMTGVLLSEALSELRGARISQAQSVEFMRLLGVKIAKKDR